MQRERLCRETRKLLSQFPCVAISMCRVAEASERDITRCGANVVRHSISRGFRKTNYDIIGNIRKSKPADRLFLSHSCILATMGCSSRRNEKKTTKNVMLTPSPLPRLQGARKSWKVTYLLSTNVMKAKQTMPLKPCGHGVQFVTPLYRQLFLQSPVPKCRSFFARTPSPAPASAPV